MLQSYLTIKNEASTELNIQKSRFIGYINRAETEEDAIDFINYIKRKHYDATHNCSAYMIGESDQIQKANDDGEPSGTAGIPILEVIKKQQLKNTVVVITRYFGGIKLGAGGLIRAYGSTTSETIKAAGIVMRKLTQEISVKLDYTQLGKVENELRSSSYILSDIIYEEHVEFRVHVEIDDVEPFCQWMTDLTNGKSIINKKDEFVYIEIDVETK